MNSKFFLKGFNSMRSKLYLIFSVFYLLITGNSILGQSLPTHFIYTANTGNNATVGIDTSIKPNILGTPLETGDEIGVFADGVVVPDSFCVGAIVWECKNSAITVWGDNSLTTVLDGIKPGKHLWFRLWRKSTNMEFPAQCAFSEGNGTYSINGIYTLRSLAARMSHFSFTENTGNNATIGIQTSIHPLINGVAIAIGDEIGVFSPGGLCVGAAVWTGSNIPITIWGDDDQTTVVDGMVGGEQLKFRMWQKSKNTEYSAQVTYTQGTSVYAANGIYQLGSLNATSKVLVKVKVFLQGPYSSGAMTTTLNTSGYIPLTQPYNVAPWNYSGGEIVSAIPNSNVVDWILVELRTGTASSSKVETRAAFLLKDGSVVDIDGSSDVAFNVATAGSYYIVVRHRNHLAVMSAAAQSLPNAPAYDFTTAQTQAYGTNPMAALTGGVFGLPAADANINGGVGADDITTVRNAVGLAIYVVTDVNMNGGVGADDITATRNNIGFATQVP